MLRVYLNRFEDAPLVWSVDRGTKATEQRFKCVVFGKADAVTRVNLDADNVTEPRCWVEVKGDMLAVVGTTALVGPNGEQLQDLLAAALAAMDEADEL